MEEGTENERLKRNAEWLRKTPDGVPAGPGRSVDLWWQRYLEFLRSCLATMDENGQDC